MASWLDAPNPPLRVTAALQCALREGLLGEDNPSALLMDMSRIERTVSALQRALAEPHFLHTMAVKACPLTAVLRLARDSGCGAECASLGEVVLALSVGFAPHRVVFDSPCKTRAELAYCLDRGVTINADSLSELQRIDVLVRARGSTPASRIGVRVNPQVGAGAIASTSTASASSKFGIALPDHRDALLGALAAMPFVTMVHCHVGSQGCPPALLVQGVQRAAAFCTEVNAALGRRQITALDIGGGLPVNYRGDEDSPTFEAFGALLREQVPQLFAAGPDALALVITEMGRSLVQKAGCLVSRVEYVKEAAAGHRVAVTHVGADLLLRTAYLPDQWLHRIVAFDADGHPKCAETHPCHTYDVAGPLCFSGDLIARDRLLPELSEGDWLTVLDAGGYTYAMFSHYNSRAAPAVLAVKDSDEDERSVHVRALRPRARPEDMLWLWQCEEADGAQLGAARDS